ncbi:armadillo-type protein [Protomyces lactucae-debilis]|uniref:Armadillo-type protein n=1 Tax=Protomyces lactucae-debilis TaxID=2754530 RepID=A0A1Y2FQ78_PROLT|nr:armadillo-type protein [Protomyces lactucae-debilis]ORY86089.1 armadillo-type protein [Protomyces lactucae-debilis]
MSGWQPDSGSLQTFTQVLAASLSPDSKLRTGALEQLDIAKSKIPDYNNYLAHIFLHPGAAETSLRSAAGLLLKNIVRFEYPEIPPPSLAYIKETAFAGLNDGEALIRSISGNLITATIHRGGIREWPEALPRLMQLLDDSNETTCEGALSALSKICEDSASELDKDYDGQRPLNFMVPKFLAFTEHPTARIRAEALFCLNQFILLKSQSLFAYIDPFLTRLFALATDQDTGVRKNVCQALVMLLDVRPDKIAPNLGSVVEYMLYSTQDQDDQVALEACEFWLAIAEQPDLQTSLEPYLHKIVPMLLKGMVYTEMDLLALGADEDDAHIEDRAEDIKPQHAKSKLHTQTEHTHDSNGPKGLKFGQDDEEEEESDDEYDDDDDDDLYAEWNLRKCSAAALDVLSTVYENRLLEHSLPHLKQTLGSQDWRDREAAVLALGAIAEGCMTGMIPILPELFPHLLSMLKDPRPLVRQITCWTLGRYGRWAAHLPDQERQQYFEPLLEGLLSAMLDNNKKVQEAGCSAFAALEDQAGIALVPYLQPILQLFVAAFDKYQQKNLLVLYDAVQTMADAVGPALNKPEYIDLLMPALIKRWTNIADDDRDLFPLLECLASVTIALGPGFAAFAPPVFSRCLQILHQNLAQIDAYANGGIPDMPDKDFLITALDLLSGLVQGLGPSVAELIESTQPPLLQLLLLCFTDPVAEVRQSAYALLGDLAINCYDCIKPYLGEIMPNALTQIVIETDSISVTNNAIWSSGEVCLQAGPDIGPWVEQLFKQLVGIVGAQKVSITVLENAAITLGRLGCSVPTQVAPHLDMFARAFCAALRDADDNDEKNSAFHGFCQMIATNPSSLAGFFPDFVNAVGRYKEPSPELNDMFGKILTGYQPVCQNWEQIVDSLEPQVKQTINTRYHI